MSDILCKMGNKRGDIRMNILGIISIIFCLLITIYTFINYLTARAVFINTLVSQWGREKGKGWFQFARSVATRFGF
jgi:hypothetical protein